MSKRLLLISGILSIIFGIMGLTFSPTILIGLGIVLIVFSNKEEKELFYDKGFITGIGILLIVLNFISAILVLIAASNISPSAEKDTNNINAPNKDMPIKNTKIQKKQIDPEVRRIDILLKLGISMVLISGILFATTTWEYINDIIKIGFLLFLSIMFFGLSNFSEKKLKLENTTFAYFILGIAFLNFTWISICYFKIISPFLSFSGPGKYLSIAITYLLLGISSIITEKKYPKNYITYFKYICFYLAFYFLLLFCKIDILLIISLITLITLIFNVLLHDKNTLFKKFTYTISYILWIPLFYKFYQESNFIFYLIASIINIVNVIYLSIDNKEDTVNSYLVPIISNLLILNSIKSYLYIEIDKTITVAIILSLISLILILLKNRLSKLLISVNKILYNTITICLIIYNLLKNPLAALIISIIYLIINMTSSIDNEFKIDNYIKPVSIYLVIKSLEVYLTRDLSINLINSFTYVTTSIVFFVSYLVSNTENNKNKYLYSLLILSVIKFIFNIFILDKIVSFTTLLTFIYFYYKYPKDNDDNKLIFIIILYNIYQLFVKANVLYTYNILNDIVVLMSYLVILYLVRKDKMLKGITSFIIILPIYNLILETSHFSELNLIFINLFQLYLLILVISYFVKNPDTKDFLLTFGIIVIMIQVIFHNSIYTALYVGIFGVLLALYGFIRKEYKSLFGLGIIITVGNIIYQLRGVWTRIPFWLYLLVFGLSIISFVMYREVNKLDNKNKKG